MNEVNIRFGTIKSTIIISTILIQDIKILLLLLLLLFLRRIVQINIDFIEFLLPLLLPPLGERVLFFLFTRRVETISEYIKYLWQIFGIDVPSEKLHRSELVRVVTISAY